MAAEGRDDRPLEGGGHPVDSTGHDREKAHAADTKVSPTKGHNLIIWIFMALLVAAIVLALAGMLFGD
jgi:hypothetical protein